MSTAFTSQAIALGFDRRYGVIRRLAATALPRWLLVAGRLAAVLATVAVQVVVLAALAAVLGWRPAGRGPGLGVAAGAARLRRVRGAGHPARRHAARGGRAGGRERRVVRAAAGRRDRRARWTGCPGPVAAAAALLPSGALAEGLRTVLTTGAGPGAGPVLVLLAWTAARHRTGGADRPAALITRGGRERRGDAAYDRQRGPTRAPRPPRPRPARRRCAGWRSPPSSRRPGSRSPGRSCGSPGPGWAARPGRSASPAASCPTPHPEVAALHQWVEFGNRLLTVRGRAGHRAVLPRRAAVPARAGPGWSGWRWCSRSAWSRRR